MRFVLDNTVTMAWCFQDEATAYTDTLLTRLSNLIDSALVPSLWLYEVVNVIGLATRKQRITEPEANSFLDNLADLPIDVEPPIRRRLFSSVRKVAAQYKLTAYDAAYLELALRHQLPLAALDNALTTAAEAAGVELVKV
ncbi:MAG TPA: type II toxin-antitoxin system VapC family toxin [Bryobacteraceae bacterium]|nr:type II toxin-antitoxin system VapC family toxin [Bryobacteraceae bacterium]